MRKEQGVDIGVQPALFADGREEVHAAEGVKDGFVGVFAGRVGVESDASFYEDRVLGDAIETGSDVLAWDLGDVGVVDEDGAGDELNHSEYAHYQGCFAAVVG